MPRGAGMLTRTRIPIKGGSATVRRKETVEVKE
jgi:hypothetical protein